MSTFRNLSYALLFLSVLSLVMIFPFSRANYSMTTFSFLGVFVAVFAVSLVALIASLTMYFHSKNTAITVLKRRGGRAYAELLHHKTLLISAMDGEKHVSDWEHYLYNPDEFPRIKKFLGEEYFLLLSCDSFFCHSKAAEAYNAFKTLHNDFADFIRSVSYDRIECAKFRKLYFRVTGQYMTSSTPEKEFESEAFSEAYEALLAANEQALSTVEGLLSKIEAFEQRLDRYYAAGTSWQTTKKALNARYQVWLHATEV